MAVVEKVVEVKCEKWLSKYSSRSGDMFLDISERVRSVRNILGPNLGFFWR